MNEKDDSLGEGYRVFVRAIDPDGNVLITIPCLAEPDRGEASRHWPNPDNAAAAVATVNEIITRVALQAEQEKGS